MSEKSKHVVLNMSMLQYELLMKGLDLFVRIGIGQFEAVLDVADYDTSMMSSVLHPSRSIIDALKGVFGHPPYGSHGIMNPKVNDHFRVAFDMYQVLRHKMAKHRASGDEVFGVASEVTPTSSYALPKVEIVDDVVLEQQAERLRMLDELAAKLSGFDLSWDQHSSSMKDKAREDVFRTLEALARCKKEKTNFRFPE